MSGTGKPFAKGHVSTHDLSKAGRKGRMASSWQVRFNANALRTIKQDRRIEMIRRADKSV